ncbi:hypothetical protein LSH36_935g00079 [Paralvinella palmiformis]|uniref:Solute carrier family 40 member n=1 Tax=Paralvinella palmiformis TaxID=53620 RepID=A0AAD9MTN2_9ANNE|nr:hypothetical protein LSH36_935g00079 [Paralvinella palmiformis]
MKVAIFVQDAAVCSCSLIVFFVVKFENDVKTIWSGGLWMLLVTIIIILSIIAQLFGMVFKISLERDWFVVVAGGDTTLLAHDDAPEKVTAASTAEETLLKQETDKIQSVECQFLTSKEAKDSTNDDVNCEGSADGKKEITSAQEQQQSSRPAVKDSCLQPLCKDLLVLCTGWRVYAKQKVALAGMGLACLYMTVLGFHAVTIGYAYANGITESIVGILTGLAGIAGILGSLIYPMLRTRLGLEKTGIFGFWFEISCLTLPLISIWLPGNASTVNGTYDATSDAPCVPTSVVTPSIVVFLIGVILSRIVAQLMQEKVAESERGVVNGVQNSLNMLFEIIKYVLVIILPYVHTYGILIMLSYGFVLTGALLFLVFVWKFRKEVSLRCETNLLPTPDYDNRPTREKTDV